MVDNDKIGNYIKDLRSKNKLTQEELADKIYVSRQAVSNWERGIDVPTVDNVKDICAVFNVSIADIYAGEKIKDIKTLNDVIHSLVTIEMKKSRKILIIASILVFFLIVMFLVYYFVTYYNNITEYVITTDNNKYKVFGVINKSVDNIYFELASDKVTDKICLVYKENDILCNTNSNFIRFSETNGYNEIIPLDKKNFNDYISSMYITLEKDNEVEKIKLDIVNDYQKSNLFKENNIEINANDKDYKLEFSNVPEKIRKEFNYNKDEDSFRLVKEENGKKIDMNYIVDSKSFEVIEINDNLLTRWSFDINENYITLYNVVDALANKIIKEYSIIYENDNNKNKKEIYNYFKENYIDKYLN